MNHLNLRNSIAVICLLLSVSSSSAETLGTYSFTGASDGQTSGFQVENPVPNTEWSELTSDMTSIGVVSSFAAGAPYANEPYASYSFDGKGYAVGFDFLPPGSNPGISGDPANAARANYLQFEFQASPGYAVTVNSVSVDFGTDFTTSFQPSAYYNLFYSLDGTNWYQVGGPSEATSNSNVYKIRDDVTKDFVEDPEANSSFSGTGSLLFRLVFADGQSGSADKRLFIDDIRVDGTVSEAPNGYTGLAYRLGSWIYFYDTSKWIWVVGDPWMYNFTESQYKVASEWGIDGFIFLDFPWQYSHTTGTWFWIAGDMWIWDTSISKYILITN